MSTMAEAAQMLKASGWRVTANGRWRHTRLDAIRSTAPGGRAKPALVTITDAIEWQESWARQEQVVQAAIEEASRELGPCPECGAYECPGAQAGVLG